MKIAGIREIREQSARYLGGPEPFLVTRHGKISGVFIPLDAPDRLPDDWKKEIGAALSQSLSKILDLRGVTEKNIEEDFRADRRRRRGR